MISFDPPPRVGEGPGERSVKATLPYLKQARLPGTANGPLQTERPENVEEEAVKWIKVFTTDGTDMIVLDQVIRISFVINAVGDEHATLYVAGGENLIAVGHVHEPDLLQMLKQMTGLEE